MPDSEYLQLKKHAKQARIPLGQWVRNALRRITEGESAKSMGDKLNIIERASEVQAPIDDPKTIKAQILSGYNK